MKARCKDTQANTEFGIAVAVIVILSLYPFYDKIALLARLTIDILTSLGGTLLLIVLSVSFFSVAEIVNKYLRKRRENLSGETSWTSSLPETTEEYLARMEAIRKENQERINKEYEENREEREKIREELERKRNEEYDKQEILRRLDKMGAVYQKKDLTKKEIKVLVENEFRQVNEYDLIEKKRIPVLVKPFHHHSIAHTFLVWSARRLIESFGIEDVREYFTVDADLVFSWKGEEYAIEVECGSLIGKKNQLKEKVGNLNKKYPERWMFIVSHRDLLKKYKKFGKTVTRSKAKEKLKKMLKSAHPKR